MKVKDLVREDIDIDVCDDYDESCWIAKCGAYRLTDEGVQEFHEALDVDVHIVDFGDDRGKMAILHCDDDDEEVAEKNVRACKKLFFSLAGYCPYDEYDKWFEEV